MIFVITAQLKLIATVIHYRLMKQIFTTNGVGCGKTTLNFETGKEQSLVQIEDANEKTVLYGFRAL